LKNNKNLILWSDAGTHFKNSEFMSYLFVELVKESIEVEWNLFQDKHGLFLKKIVILQILIINFKLLLLIYLKGKNNR
jgi:hypothetical protein